MIRARRDGKKRLIELAENQIKVSVVNHLTKKKSGSSWVKIESLTGRITLLISNIIPCLDHARNFRRRVTNLSSEIPLKSDNENAREHPPRRGESVIFFSFFSLKTSTWEISFNFGIFFCVVLDCSCQEPLGEVSQRNLQSTLVYCFWCFVVDEARKGVKVLSEERLKGSLRIERQDR